MVPKRKLSSKKTAVAVNPQIPHYKCGYCPAVQLIRPSGLYSDGQWFCSYSCAENFKKELQDMIGDF